MHQPNFNSQSNYLELCKFLDDYVAKSVEEYVQSRQITVAQVQQGWGEVVSKLRKSQDPNYNLPGSPVAYAFQYLPKKITAMVGVISYYYAPGRALPKRVLDIGSGTNAVSIALGCCIKDQPVEVVALEPSSAMRDFTNFESKEFPNLEITSNPGKVSGLIEDIVDKHGSDEYSQYHNYFDLIVMSSALPYYFTDHPDKWWQDLAKALKFLSTINANLIILEPTIKRPLLEKKVRGMSSGGWKLEGGESKLLREMLPTVVDKQIPLQKLTNLKKQYQIVDEYPVNSWNTYSNYNEYVLFCKKAGAI